LIRKLSWKDIKAQTRWLYSVSQGFKRSILLLTGLSTATSLLSVWSAILIKSLIDMAVGAQQGRSTETALLFILVLVAEIALNAAYSILNSQAKTKQANNLQRLLFRKFMAAKWQAISARHSGDYCNLMISDVEVVNSFLLSTIPDIIATFSQLLAASWLLLRLEPMLALLALTITPVFVLMARLFARPMREATIKIQGLKGENLSFSQESIQNVITIRAFEQQAEACRKLNGLQSNLLFWTMRRTKLGTLSGVIQSVSWSATYILSLLWGISRLSQKAISYGSIAAYLQLVAQIQGPLRRLAAQIPQMIATSASIGRLIEVLDMTEEELNKCDSAFTGAVGVTFQDINFSYQDGEKVLDMLNMEIAPGVMTALVGPTGAGKSTVVRLLLGLVEPQSGCILLNRSEGDSFQVGACSRNAFTYVQQGNTAISGTIADNLRMAKPTASPEEMENVLKQACAWDFVSILTYKTESRIGEHGIGLSEGQQQRLAIARALLRDAPILILDEATSALDKKTEAQVLKNIQSALCGRTCLVITHRSAALKLCSRVYRLYNGKAYKSSTNIKGSKMRFKIKKDRSYFRAAPAS
jgi:ATP-binding cassette, subfamily B, bacterial